MNLQPTANSRSTSALRSFTLTELLVAMGIIAIIAGVTAISVRTIARDAKLSSASNTVAAALDTARGIAIRDNRHTAVVFRARLVGGRDQYVEVITAQSVGAIGDMYPGAVIFPPSGTGVVERFVPVPGIAARQLPRGIKVAAPWYIAERDDDWLTVSHLPATVGGEAGGVVIAVLYGPDGRVRMRRDDASAARYFVDVNNDGEQHYDGLAYPPDDLPAAANTTYCDFGTAKDGSPVRQFYCQRDPLDEPYLLMAPFLAVYDDARARDYYDTSQWTSAPKRNEDLSEFINNYADRIHFNRYTGVVLR